VEAQADEDYELEEPSPDVTRLELRSIVGRMLWKETWGRYVDGDQWWWDDKNVVDECEYMGTCWEYTTIEAVKEVKAA
jgi:hypothetical protein